MYIHLIYICITLSLSPSCPPKQTILKMEHVTFTYPGKETPQLTDVSLRVRGNETTGGREG